MCTSIHTVIKTYSAMSREKVNNNNYKLGVFPENLMQCHVYKCVYDAGLLCGSCKENKGVSVLLNRCVKCSNGFITLLIALSKIQD